jgi:cobalt/nickel transport protein
MKKFTILLALPLVLLSAGAALAHFPLLLPLTPWGTHGQALEVVYTFGHPFEVEAAPAARPVRFAVFPPGKPAVDLLAGLGGAAGEERPEWRARFTPTDRGDHVVALTGPVLAHGGKKLQDFVKVVVHVPALQGGWDRALGDPLEVVPLTRPYGLAAGGVFRAEVLAEGAPLAGAEVEVEYRNEQAPDPLPDEPFITGVEKTDRSGAFGATLGKPGWWIVSASRETPQGVQRASLWVHVGPLPR